MQDEQNPYDQRSAVETATRDRVPAVVVDDHELLTETEMDAPWEYNQRVYEIWAIYDHWPSGFLMHMAGPSEYGVMIQSVWQTTEHEATYMAEVGVERYTEVAHVLTDEGSPPVDLLPTNCQLVHLSFGPLAANFIDIGPDIDGAAAKQFGTELTAVDVRMPALSEEQLATLWQRLDVVDSAAPDQIVRIELIRDGVAKNTFLWVSEDAAREFIDSEVAPLYRELAGEEAEEPQLEFRRVERLAIGSSALDPVLFDAN